MSWCMDVSVVIPENTYLSLANEKILQYPPSNLSNFKIDGVDFVRIDWDWWNHWEDSGGKSFLAEVRKTDSYAYAYVDEFGSSSCKSCGSQLKDYFQLKKYIEDSNGKSRFINNYISDGIKKVVLSSFRNGITFSQAQKYFDLPDDFLKEMKDLADWRSKVQKATEKQKKNIADVR